MMRVSRDIIIGTLCLLAGGVGLYLVQSPLLTQEMDWTDHLEIEVGDLSARTAGVRYRVGSSLVWQDVPSGKKRVRVGDAIFTASNAHAELDYEAGERVDIQPNSLVVVNLPTVDDGERRLAMSIRPVLTIEKGSVKIGFNGEKKPLLVEAHGKIYEISSSVVSQTEYRAPAALVTNQTPAPQPSSVRFIRSESEVTVALDDSSGKGIRVTDSSGAPAQNIVVEEVHVPVTEKAKDLALEPEALTPSPSPSAVVSLAPAPAPSRAPITPPPAPKPSASHAKTVSPKPRYTKKIQRPSPAPEKRKEPPVELKSPDLEEPLAIRGPFFLIAPDFGFSKLSATDLSTGSTAQLASQLDLGVSIKYQLPVSDRLNGYLGLRLGAISFEAPSEGDKTLVGGSEFTFGFAAGVSYSVTPRLSFGFELSDRKEGFVRGVSTTSVTVDELMIPSAGVKLGYEFFQSPHLNLGISADFSYLFAGSGSSYTVDSGTREGASLYLDRQLSSTSILHAELGYHGRSQGTSLTNQSEQSVVFSVGVALPY